MADTKTDKLKPCPFCGEDKFIELVNIDYIGDTYVNEYKVECHRHDCLVCPETLLFDTEKEAVTAWNTRHGDTA